MGENTVDQTDWVRLGRLSLRSVLTSQYVSYNYKLGLPTERALSNERKLIKERASGPPDQLA